MQLSISGNSSELYRFFEVFFELTHIILDFGSINVLYLYVVNSKALPRLHWTEVGLSLIEAGSKI